MYDCTGADAGAGEGAGAVRGVEVLSVERSFFYRDLLYTDNDFNFYLGFSFSTETMASP